MIPLPTGRSRSAPGLSNLETAPAVMCRAPRRDRMATDERTRPCTDPVEAGSYLSPTADFLLLFGVGLLVAAVAASVLFP